MKLYLLLLLALMAACGKPSEGTPSLKTEPLKAPDMLQVMVHQNIRCVVGDCPTGIGRIFAINQTDHNKSAMCTAFLIRPDVVMTNSHCIWAGKLNDEETCQQLYLAFPTEWGYSETTRCKEILWRDTTQGGRRHYRRGENDFALIRITSRMPGFELELSPRGMRTGEMVYPVVADFLNVHEAKILHFPCLVEKHSEKTGVAQLYHCPIISGNSGSPVLDRKNRVAGIIFASSDANVRKPEDEFDTRIRATSKGYAFSMDYVLSLIGAFIPEEEVLPLL
jgi:hypothetical protein